MSILRAPDVRVEIADEVYALRAFPIDDEVSRTQILHDRGYWHAWDSIKVFRFLPRESRAPGASGG